MQSGQTTAPLNRARGAIAIGGGGLSGGLDPGETRRPVGRLWEDTTGVRLREPDRPAVAASRPAPDMVDAGRFVASFASELWRRGYDPGTVDACARRAPEHVRVRGRP